MEIKQDLIEYYAKEISDKQPIFVAFRKKEEGIEVLGYLNNSKEVEFAVAALQGNEYEFVVVPYFEVTTGLAQ